MNCTLSQDKLANHDNKDHRNKGKVVKLECILHVSFKKTSVFSG